MAASSRMSRTFARQSPRSRIATIVIGVLKNWASCHPTKPVRLMPCERPPELQNRVQTIRAGTPTTKPPSNHQRWLQYRQGREHENWSTPSVGAADLLPDAQAPGQDRRHRHQVQPHEEARPRGSYARRDRLSRRGMDIHDYRPVAGVADGLASRLWQATWLDARDRLRPRCASK